MNCKIKIFTKLIKYVTLLSLLLLVSCARGSEGALDARVLSVFRLDGDAVSLQRTDGRRVEAIYGMGLHAGYAVSTGFNSFCHIRLDTDSIVKMDETTDISVAQINDRLLRINIDRGQVMVSLQEQAPEHELEALIGNTVISVRGTLFVAGVYAEGEAVIHVLEGKVYVNGVPLYAGYTMHVYDGLDMIYEITPFDFGAMDSFLLMVVADNAQRLLASNFDIGDVMSVLAGDDELPDEAAPNDSDDVEYIPAYADEQIDFVSPELRAAALFFADILQFYIGIYGISHELGQYGVYGAELVDLDDSGVPVLALLYTAPRRNMAMIHIAVYSFENSPGTPQIMSSMVTGGLRYENISVAVDVAGQQYLVYTHGGAHELRSDFYKLENGALIRAMFVRSLRSWFLSTYQPYVEMGQSLNIVSSRELMLEPIEDVLAMLHRLAK